MISAAKKIEGAKRYRKEEEVNWKVVDSLMEIKISDASKHLKDRRRQKGVEQDGLKEQFGTRKRQYIRVIKRIKKIFSEEKELKRENSEKKINWLKKKYKRRPEERLPKKAEKYRNISILSEMINGEDIHKATSPTKSRGSGAENCHSEVMQQTLWTSLAPGPLKKSTHSPKGKH